MHQWVSSRNLVNEEALAHWGLLCQIKKKLVKALQISNKCSIIYQELDKIILHSILVVHLSVHVQQENSSIRRVSVQIFYKGCTCILFQQEICHPCHQFLLCVSLLIVRCLSLVWISEWDVLEACMSLHWCYLKFPHGTFQRHTANQLLNSCVCVCVFFFF